MAAPSGTIWGSTVGSYGKLGIYVKLTEISETKIEREVQIWFASKYSVSDTSNTLYYDCSTDTTSASTNRGGVSISTTHDSGSGWSDTNEKKIKTYTTTHTKGTSAVKYKAYAKLVGVDRVGGTMYVNTTYTIPALDSWTVSYNANGGSGAPSSQKKYYGKTLTLSSTKPTRSGYTFVGWGTSNTDTSANWSPGGSYTTNASDTLYAIWKKTITLSYGNNGGSGSPSSQSATIYNATTSYKFTLSNTKPTRTGYTFLGWSTSSSATSASYSSGGTITLSSSDTLYAVWKINTYTVSYNANGGTGAPSNQKKTYGVSLILSNTIPTREGYNFIGWGASETATSIVNEPGGTYTGNSNYTYYAIWELKTYTISFNGNGGTDVPDSQIKTYGVDLVLSTKVPVKVGYKFLGWSTVATDEVPTYVSGDVFTTNEDTLLYAIWEQQGIASVNIDGIWKRGKIWVNVNGTWKSGLLYANVNGTWKQGGA